MVANRRSQVHTSVDCLGPLPTCGDCGIQKKTPSNVTCIEMVCTRHCSTIRAVDSAVQTSHRIFLQCRVEPDFSWLNSISGGGVLKSCN